MIKYNETVIQYKYKILKVMGYNIVDIENFFCVGGEGCEEIFGVQNI
jgi:hypothetical protein